jgi:hypothetical protein
MRRILIVDDDRPICFVIDAWLGRHGLRSQPPIAVRRAPSPRRAACARSSGKIFGKNQEYWGKILGPATWLEVIDECPAADKSYRKQVVVLPPSSKAPSEPRG